MDVHPCGLDTLQRSSVVVGKNHLVKYTKQFVTQQEAQCPNSQVVQVSELFKVIVNTWVLGNCYGKLAKCWGEGAFHPGAEPTQLVHTTGTMIMSGGLTRT